MTRRQTVIGAAAVLVLLVVLYSRGAFDSTLSSVGLNNRPCVVLALGGRKLCGNDAKAWCRATQPLRDEAPNNPSVENAQQICDQIGS